MHMLDPLISNGFLMGIFLMVVFLRVLLGFEGELVEVCRLAPVYKHRETRLRACG